MSVSKRTGRSWVEKAFPRLTSSQGLFERGQSLRPLIIRLCKVRRKECFRGWIYSRLFSPTLSRSRRWLSRNPSPSEGCSETNMIFTPCQQKLSFCQTMVFFLTGGDSTVKGRKEELGHCFLEIFLGKTRTFALQKTIFSFCPPLPPHTQMEGTFKSSQMVAVPDSK